LSVESIFQKFVIVIRLRIKRPVIKKTIHKPITILSLLSCDMFVAQQRLLYIVCTSYCFFVSKVMTIFSQVL